MSHVQFVEVGAIDGHRFASVLTDDSYRAFVELIEHGSRHLEGRVIWNVNSTAKGGGVVELLRPLLGYARGAGVDARWAVVSGEPEFFTVTKRIHNRLHGFDGDGKALGDHEHEVYERTLSADVRELADQIRPGDVVILHDPQTAGIVEAMKRTGATVIWRCHIGADKPNDRAREAWSFLERYVGGADAFVFSRAAFAWDVLDPDRITVIQPTIDAFAPKNADQEPAQTRAILSRAGVVPDGRDPASFTRSDGTPGRVDRRAEMTEVAPLRPADRLVVQVSRWDTLKDPLGVIAGFAEHVAADTDGHLLLAGPSTESVADDPEGAAVFGQVCETWSQLPDPVRSRVHLASLPMDDTDENAAIVNAIQRHATIVVQKSVAEGFGLTVAEAMWKARPVVASRIGGIQDQIVDGESGILISDPTDLPAFGTAVAGLLRDPERARTIGAAARVRVRDHFLGPYSLARYFDLIERLIAT